MQSVLTEVAELAAYGSMVMGELPCMTRAEAEELLGGAGMLGTLQPEVAARSSSPDVSRCMPAARPLCHVARPAMCGCILAVQDGSA